MNVSSLPILRIVFGFVGLVLVPFGSGFAKDDLTIPQLFFAVTRILHSYGSVNTEG